MRKRGNWLPCKRQNNCNDYYSDRPDAKNSTLHPNFSIQLVRKVGIIPPGLKKKNISPGQRNCALRVLWRRNTADVGSICSAILPILLICYPGFSRLFPKLQEICVWKFFIQ
ncbi:hypothetical protein CDAR_273241 [Caerostris darwini]|uniref:Uncharacterized protein n=1 Tax=Caerostris darwini TaxID=1538125 RepID=A0AAV4SQD0_9ARAC|nr:hypothetical protein CDAR_273241 [Caerostris darwini]